MLRRGWIGLAAGVAARAWQGGQAPADTVDAGATADRTPRVGIVLSSFAGGEDHDGTEFIGLPNPVPTDSSPGDGVLEDMVGKAIELGNTRRGGLSRIVRERDWVVVMPRMAVCQGRDGSLIPGSVADVRVARGVLKWLAEQRRGSRITIAGAACWGMERAFDPWESDWDGAYGGTSYRGLIEEMSVEYPSARFDLIDLTTDKTIALQPPGGFSTPDETAPVFDLPATLAQCGKLITVAPLSTSTRTAVSLTLGSYDGVLPSAPRERLRDAPRGSGSPHERLALLYSLRPPDYAILGGERGLEGNGPYGPDAASVRHNLVLGGASGLAVDAVGAAIMGFDPERIEHLKLAARRGFGIVDTDSVWTRGNEIDDAKRPFRPAASP